VYVLSSHSHFYVPTPTTPSTGAMRQTGAVVLPGWVIGTAGAERYALPAKAKLRRRRARARLRLPHRFGGARDGQIAFAFHELGAAELQAVRSPDYEAEDVAFCVDLNPEPGKLSGALAPTVLRGRTGTLKPPRYAPATRARRARGAQPGVAAA
jgi:hypothetical protein